jgi:hypothetical protein
MVECNPFALNTSNVAHLPIIEHLEWWNNMLMDTWSNVHYLPPFLKLFLVKFVRLLNQLHLMCGCRGLKVGCYCLWHHTPPHSNQVFLPKYFIYNTFNLGLISRNFEIFIFLVMLLNVLKSCSFWFSWFS